MGFKQEGDMIQLALILKNHSDCCVERGWRRLRYENTVEEVHAGAGWWPWTWREVNRLGSRLCKQNRQSQHMKCSGKVRIKDASHIFESSNWMVSGTM